MALESARSTRIWTTMMFSTKPTSTCRASGPQQFTYVFDLGDDWTHVCTVVEAGTDPREVLGVVPNAHLPYFGWGNPGSIRAGLG